MNNNTITLMKFADMYYNELVTMYCYKYNKTKDILTQDDYNKIDKLFNEEMSKLKDFKTAVSIPLYNQEQEVNFIEFVDYILDDHYISYNGTIFTKEKSSVIDIVEGFLKNRKVIKKKMLKFKAKGDLLNTIIYFIKQLTEKLYANTIYGALGLITFFLFNIDVVSTVTKNAKEQLKTIILQLEKLFGNKVLLYTINDLKEYIISNSIINININPIKFNSSKFKPMSNDELTEKFIKYLTIDISDEEKNDIKNFISEITKNDFVRLRLSYLNEIEKFLKDANIEKVIKDNIDNLANIEKYDQGKFIDNILNSDIKYIKELVYDNHIQTDIADVVDKPRKAVLTTDTDSVFIKVEKLTSYLSDIISKLTNLTDKQDIEIVVFRIISFITGHCTDAFLEQMNKYHHNNPSNKVFKYKSEYFYRRLFILKSKKTYFGLLTVQEGYKIPIDIDKKNLSKTSFPNISKELLNELSDYIAKSDKLSIVKLYNIYEKYKNIIKERVNKGDYTLGTPGTFRFSDNFKFPYSQNTYLAGNIYNILFPIDSFNSPEKEHIFNLLLPKIDNYNKLSEKEKIEALKNHYIKIMPEDIFNKFSNLLDCNDSSNIDLYNMKQWVIKEAGIKYIGVKNYIPDWLIPIIDVNLLTKKNIDAYASRIMEALDIHINSLNGIKEITPIIKI